MKETLLHRITEGLRDMCYIWAKEMRNTITDEGMLIFLIQFLVLFFFFCPFNNKPYIVFIIKFSNFIKY